MSEEERNDWCFGCGKANPIGLKMTFALKDGKYTSVFKAGPEHQSYEGTVHGGILSALLDETMGRYHCRQGVKAITARLETRFRRPTPIGEPLTVCGWVVKERGKLIEMAGSVALADGTVTVEAKASMIVAGTIDPEAYRDEP
ncbi:MAG: PaaI family thioesterase [Alphaproteobacteria bacterium]|nr:PaaI family thioesterase [Alphaproteobacteria bacterium]